METIGFLELNSIARGIEAADIMVKTADVSLIVARPSCPGKYHVLVTGEVAAVKASLDAGKYCAEECVVDSVVIPRVHPQVISAISLASMPDEIMALGVIEFMSVTGAIYAADAAVKAAQIDLIEVRLGTGIGGKSFVTLTGEVGAVEESVKAGAAAGKESGLLLNTVVIPNPHRDLVKNLL